MISVTLTLYTFDASDEHHLKTGIAGDDDGLGTYVIFRQQLLTTSLSTLAAQFERI